MDLLPCPVHVTRSPHCLNPRSTVDVLRLESENENEPPQQCNATSISIAQLAGYVQGS